MGFIEKVCIEMERQGVSVAELATWADMSCTALLQIVDGKRTPRRSEVRDIKRKLNI